MSASASIMHQAKTVCLGILPFLTIMPFLFQSAGLAALPLTIAKAVPIGVMALLTLLHWRQITLSKFDMTVIAFMAYSAVTAFPNPAPFSIEIFEEIIVCGVLYAYIKTVLGDQAWQTIITALCVTIPFFAVAVLVTEYLDPRSFYLGNGASLPFATRQSTAIPLAFAFLAWLVRYIHKPHITGLLCLLLIGVTLACTQYASTIIFTLFLSLIYLIWHFKNTATIRKSALTNSVMLLIAIIGFLTITPFNELVTRKFHREAAEVTSHLQAEEQRSYTYRSGVMILALEKWWEGNKIIGYGLGKTSLNPQSQLKYPHNAPVQVLAETGLIGLAFYITLFIWALRLIPANAQSYLFLALTVLITMISGIYIARIFFIFLPLALYAEPYGSQNKTA